MFAPPPSGIAMHQPPMFGPGATRMHCMLAVSHISGDGQPLPLASQVFEVRYVAGLHIWFAPQLCMPDMSQSLWQRLSPRQTSPCTQSIGGLLFGLHAAPSAAVAPMTSQNAPDAVSSTSTCHEHAWLGASVFVCGHWLCAPNGSQVLRQRPYGGACWKQAWALVQFVARVATSQ